MTSVLEHVLVAHPATVRVAGARMRYRVAGTGPALILVHGLTGSGDNWARNIEALSEFRTVYALDLVNSGASERVPRLDASLAAHAARIVQFMDELGIDAADFAGHSHGAAISMMVAANYPRRVRKMVLFAPANPYCTLGHKQMKFYATPVGSVFASYVIPKMPRFMHRRSLERMYAEKSRIGPGVLEGYTGTLDKWGIRNILAIMLRWQEDMAALKAAIPKIKHFDSLLVWGDSDRAVALDSGRKLAEAMGAPLEVVADAGHIAFQELPDVVTPMMREWLLGVNESKRHHGHPCRSAKSLGSLIVLGVAAPAVSRGRDTPLSSVRRSAGAGR